MAEDLISNQILKPSTEEAETGRSELQDSQGYIEKSCISTCVEVKGPHAGVPITELRSSDLVLSLLISTIFAGLNLSI